MVASILLVDPPRSWRPSPPLVTAPARSNPKDKELKDINSAIEEAARSAARGSCERGAGEGPRSLSRREEGEAEEKNEANGRRGCEEGGRSFERQRSRSDPMYSHHSLGISCCLRGQRGVGVDLASDAVSTESDESACRQWQELVAPARMWSLILAHLSRRSWPDALFKCMHDFPYPLVRPCIQVRSSPIPSAP